MLEVIFEKSRWKMDYLRTKVAVSARKWPLKL
jgi:hypothetical protein